MAHKHTGIALIVGMMFALSVGCSKSTDLEERGEGPASTKGEQVAAAQGTTGKDAALEAEVERRLNAAPELAAAKNLDVEANDGVVVLKGQVSAEAQRRKAEEIAKAVEGVERVDNRLEIATA